MDAALILDEYSDGRTVTTTIKDWLPRWRATRLLWGVLVAWAVLAVVFGAFD